MKYGQLIDMVMGIIFSMVFEDWVLNPDPFQFTNQPQLIKNKIL